MLTELGGYKLVDPKDDVEERSPKGKYASILLDFEDSYSIGEKKEIVKEDGGELGDAELKKMYQGLLQAKRYQAMKGRHIQVRVQRKDGKLYLIKEG